MVKMMNISFAILFFLLANEIYGEKTAMESTEKSDIASSQAKIRKRMEDAGAEVRIFKKTAEIDLMLAIYQPKGYDRKQKRPAIVLWHGGGFKGGSPLQFKTQCQHFASRGLVAIGPQYRLKKHGVTPHEAVMDGASAIRWIRKHAEELGIDPDRIIAGGGSAGGTIATMLATSDQLNDPSDDLSISRIPNALVLYNPVIDAVGEGNWRAPDKEKLIQVFGDDEEKRAQISSVRYIGPHTPPALILYPELDITPLKTIEKFQAGIQAYDKRCDIHMFKNQRHAFFNTKNEGGKFARATTVLADQFLVSLGFLEPDSTLVIENDVDVVFLPGKTD